MKPTTLTCSTLITALMLAVTLAATPVAHADEQTTPAGAALSAPAAPAPNPATAIEPGRGCMPGGGCCGACQQAPAVAAPDDGSPRAAAGGCPCQKNRQKPAS